MPNVVAFPSFDQLLCVIAVYRQPDGAIRAQISDMPVKVIEATGHDVPSRMREVADWIAAGAEYVRGEAAKMEPTA